MKNKLISISLIVLLAVNWFGYQIIAGYLEKKALADMQTKLDTKHYNDNELISIKIPFELPYGSGSEEFTMSDGSIDINGITYQYVKKRVYKGNLEILCIPNFTKSSIKKSKDDFSKQVNDIATTNTSKKSSGSQTVKVSIPDFTVEGIQLIQLLSGTTVLTHASKHVNHSSSAHLRAFDQPPQA